MKRHFLVIGAQRCGTTSLQALLEAHPDIAMAQPARPEPKVFLAPDVVERGLDWYQATYFAHVISESLLGEKSTSYLEHAAAAERAAAVLGQVPIVVQLRDPVARAVSNWRFSSANGLEHRPLEQALEENLDGRPTDWDPGSTSVSPYAYVERGRYVDYLQPWFAVFPDTVHVRFLEELSPQDGSLAELYDALGVDPSFVPPRPHRPARQSDGPAPTLAPELVSRLRACFRDADERLRELLSRDLPWPTG